MTWRYRVVYDGHHYTLCEEYLNDAGELTAYTDGSMIPYGETLDELRADLEDMLAALEMPTWERCAGERTTPPVRGDTRESEGRVMSHMSYCRFQTTLSYLRDCAKHLHNALNVHGPEHRARAELAELLQEILDDMEGTSGHHLGTDNDPEARMECGACGGFYRSGDDCEC